MNGDDIFDVGMGALLILIIAGIVYLGVAGGNNASKELDDRFSKRVAEQTATIKAYNDKGGTVTVLTLNSLQLMQCILPKSIK